jgi:hypothetical protein
MISGTYSVMDAQRASGSLVLHLKEKSMVRLAMGCGWREQEVKVTS